MSTPDLPQLEPVRNDGVRAIQVGLGLYAAVGLVLVIQFDELADRGTQWWLAVCGAGFLIGMVQLVIFVRRRTLIQARDDARLDDPGSQPTDAEPTS